VTTRDDLREDARQRAAAATGAPVPSAVAMRTLGASADDAEEVEDLDVEIYEEEFEDLDVEEDEGDDEAGAAGGGTETDTGPGTGPGTKIGSLVERAAAAAAKDTEWARRVDGFVQTRVLGYESLSKGAQAKLHGTFQEVVDEVLEALLEATGIEGEALLHEVMQLTPESLRLPSTHRARALQMLALDNAKALHTLMMSEHSAALADPVRRAALVAGANATWQSQVRTFHSQHRLAFKSGDGSSVLSWTTIHEQFQVACEEVLEAVMERAKVDPEQVLTALMASVPDLAASIAPPGLTPLPTHAWLPLRAFVEYQAFEEMMKADMSAWEQP
jgi:hypothetical protein